LAIDIVIPESFLKKLNALPKDVRLKFWEQMERLAAHPSYPSLRNEKLQGTDQGACSITMHYSATYVRDKKTLL